MSAATVRPAPFVAAIASAALTRAALAAVAGSRRAAAWERTNFRGQRVSLASGPAVAVGATMTAAGVALCASSPRLASAILVAGLGAAVAGRYDDVVGERPAQRSAKGLRGHLRAARSGTLTGGLVKAVGIGTAAAVASAALPARVHGRWPRAAEVVAGAGVIATMANALNLLDLRPGRALKVAAVVALPLLRSQPPPAPALAAAVLGAAVAVMGPDLRERGMLGDTGANALGALLGVAAALRLGLPGRAGLLAGLLALTAVSERVSLSAVIDATPFVRRLDRLGRLD